MEHVMTYCALMGENTSIFSEPLEKQEMGWDGWGDGQEKNEKLSIWHGCRYGKHLCLKKHVSFSEWDNLFLDSTFHFFL